MIITFFDIKGIVHNEFVSTGQIVNSGLYCDVLRRLRENVRRRHPELWRQQAWLLHHDNVPSHTSVLTQQFLSKNKMTVISHPPYSPDLTPCDFFLFQKIKLKLKGRRLDTIEEILAEL
jgi:histone-lysine N-methyltransferase SETMAR